MSAAAGKSPVVVLIIRVFVVVYLCVLGFCSQTQSRMKMIADNYEEDYIHPQHHPHHSHHMHPANVHHRSLPRAPLHANHRPPVEQVGTNTHAAQSCLHRRDAGSRLHHFKSNLNSYSYLSFHHESVVVRTDSMKFPFSICLGLFSLKSICSCQNHLYHLEKQA